MKYGKMYHGIIKTIEKKIGIDGNHLHEFERREQGKGRGSSDPGSFFLENQNAAVFENQR